MSKLERFSAALIAVAMFATPAMARQHHPKSRGTTKTAHTSKPPRSFTLAGATASGLQTSAHLPQLRIRNLRANRHTGTDTSLFGATSMRRAGVTFIASPPYLVATLHHSRGAAGKTHLPLMAS
jgi:hypothetical protein